MSAPVGQIAATDYDLGGIEPPSQPIPDHSPPPRPDAPTPGTCHVCGAGPVAEFTFRQVTGMLFRWQMQTHNGQWCGPCALAIGRSAQNKSMSLGWFGLISGFVNLAMVPANALELLKAKNLDSTPNTNTLDPGTPVFLRLGSLITAGVLGLLSFLLVSAALDNSKAVENLAVGDCVAEPDALEITTIDVVSCAEPHMGEAYYNGKVIGFNGFPGDEQIFDQVDQACYQQFEGYVGTAFETSALYFTSFTPTSQSWSQGDRGFTCLIVAEQGNLTGSVKGTGR